MFAIVTACHNDATLDANLHRSPLLADIPLHVGRNASSASIACNRGLDATTAAPYVIFAHHDICLPLRRPITKISRSCLHLWRDLRAARKSAAYRFGVAVRTHTQPEIFAERCGWSSL